MYVCNYKESSKEEETGKKRGERGDKATRARLPYHCLAPRLVLHEDGSSSIPALGSIIGSQNGLLHSFFS
jgi:hypothetical protein